MQGNMQTGSITTNLKVQICFTLPELSAKKIVMWNYHVDDSAKYRYYIILAKDVLTDFEFNLKFSDHVISEDEGPFKGSTAPMFDMGTY